MSVRKVGVVVTFVVGASACISSVGSEDLGQSESELAQISNQVILDWNIHTQDVSGTDSPPRRSRTFAMVSIAMHDALNGIDHRYARYASTANDSSASPVAAAAKAAHDVLVALFPMKTVELDGYLNDSLAGIKSECAKTRGVALGTKAAEALLQKRANDGASVVGTYMPAGIPGRWRPTPPMMAPALEPAWGHVTPFGLTSGDQFRAPAPYALNSAKYTADFEEVRLYGSAASMVRSPDETAYARFWYEPSALGWNRLARAALEAHPKNLWKSARLFALMNMAMADGYIASFDTKYTFDNWRPITAIREAATDGNLDTDPDTAWTPLMPTPPIPDHTSGHAVAGFASAAALIDAFGDHLTVKMTSTTAVPMGSERTWDSFTQAADENADSRVKVGIHFRKSCDDGEAQGRDVGDWVVAHSLGKLD